MMRAGSRCGSALVEFAFAGIPILFVILSVIEISRGMWTYETLSYAVTEATRLAAVHGASCVTAPNNCPIFVADIAQRIADSSHGLLADQMSVTLVSPGLGSVTCQLSDCLNNGAPVSPGDTPGANISVAAAYPFTSPMSVFFPGFGGSASFGATTLHASSQEQIQF